VAAGAIRSPIYEQGARHVNHPVWGMGLEINIELVIEKLKFNVAMISNSK
jgi:hypothetical protein